MTHHQDKTAFVTGGASGIGYALAEKLLREGANVMIADINEETLQQAREKLSEKARQGQLDAVVCDVAKPESVQAAADKTIERFGKVHYVVNNAGVGLAGTTGEVPLEDWRWIVDINLLGVVYGIEIFTPLIKAHGEGGHIINTASMAGHFAMPTMTPYHATKYAVVGISEALRGELAPQGINVSVLCPGWVKTNIHNTVHGRPSGDGAEPTEAQAEHFSMTAALVENGIAPAAVAELVTEAIEQNRFYIFTHPEMREAIDQRYQMISEDYETCVTSERFQKALRAGGVK
jgi:NAD(P)-dependent dehydrogenase (short-subunit alcohol dehydrogenase family)